MFPGLQTGTHKSMYLLLSEKYIYNDLWKVIKKEAKQWKNIYNNHQKY